MRSNKPRFWTVDARITALEPQRCMTFRFGFGGLMTFEESYCVVPVPVGSRLVHSFRCTGLLSALKHRNMRKNFAKMLEITDRLFQRHLPPARPPSPKKRPRKGFRPNACRVHAFGPPQAIFGRDQTSVGEGRGGSVRVGVGGRRNIK